MAGRASDSEASRPSGEGALWARRCLKRGAAGGAGREEGVSQGRKTERRRLYTERPCSSRGAPPPGPRPSLRGSRVTARKPRRHRAPCSRGPGLWPLPALRGPSGQGDTRCPPRPSRQEENVHWRWESQGAFPETPSPRLLRLPAGRQSRHAHRLWLEVLENQVGVPVMHNLFLL